MLRWYIMRPVSAYNLQKNELALKYFQEYLNTGTEAQEKDCYVYMNMIYQSQKKYADQERYFVESQGKISCVMDFSL